MQDTTLTPTQFMLTVNRKSGPWEDVMVDLKTNDDIARCFTEEGSFKSFIHQPESISNLYVDRVREIISKGDRDFIITNDITNIVDNTEGVLHVKSSVRVIYGDRQQASEHHSLTLERWGYVPGTSTYTAASPCIEDYVFEVKFMER